MNKEEFNKYCAEVMGWALDIENRYLDGIQFVIYAPDYSPYDDLNPRLPVVDELVKDATITMEKLSHVLLFEHYMKLVIDGAYTIDKATKEFIMSTMHNKHT